MIPMHQAMHMKGEESTTFVPTWLLISIIAVVLIGVIFYAVSLKMGSGADAGGCASRTWFMNSLYEAIPGLGTGKGC